MMYIVYSVVHSGKADLLTYGLCIPYTFIILKLCVGRAFVRRDHVWMAYVRHSILNVR